MKKIKFIFILLIPFLCSFTSYSNGRIVLEYHSLTQAVRILDDNGNNIENQQVYTSGVGHSYIVIHNTTSSTVNVGYYKLPPNDNVSVGLRTACAWGSVSGSLESSSSSDSSTFNHSGVLYNYDRMKFAVLERPKDDVYVTLDLSISKLNEISTIIKNQNNNYNLIWYNCSNFATEIRNKAADKNYYNGWFRNPGAICNEIKTDYKYSFLNGNFALEPSMTACYYDTSKNSMINLSLSL